MNAEGLKVVEAVRRELHALSERIFDHAFLRALEAGRIEREHLRHFAVQQSHIIDSDLRSVAMMVARATTEHSRAFFLELLDGERAARQALGAFRAAVERGADTPIVDEPVPGAFAYCAYVAWLAVYASEAEFAGALLINLPVWGANCGRIADALRRQYRLSDADVAFFTLFATAPAGFEDRAAAVIAEGLESGVTQAMIRRAASLLQGYELLFWDTMATASMVSK
jgi:thiaminase